MRLQKYISQCGITSRRKAEHLISNGKISVNGHIVTTLGTIISPDKDIITYQGKKIEQPKANIYIILNKPVGYITSLKDEFGRKTVIDLIPTDMKVFPVGRLDYNSRGLLLLTNDGDLAYKLTHPKHNISKTYIVKINGRLTKNKLNNLQKGIKIEDYITKPAKISIISEEEKTTTLKFIISEGKNRQIRKMIEAVNHKVINLNRIEIGKISLGNLKTGQYRSLTKEEIIYLGTV